jgi:TIR domain
MMTIFLSYKRDDLVSAQRLVLALRNAQQDVWWDQDIAPSEPWEEIVESQLEAAKVVIVAWSKSAIKSENVKAEARRARIRGKLIQVFFEECEPPVFFGERQGVSLVGWSGDPNDNNFQALLVAVQAIASGRRPPQGVGYAPRKRNRWGTFLGYLAFAVAVLGVISDIGGARETLCSIDMLRGICRVSSESTRPQVSPEKTRPAQTERTRLLSDLQGTWIPMGNEQRATSCNSAIKTTIITETDDAGVSRVRLAGPGDYVGIAQVTSAEGGAVVTQGVSDGEFQTWTYYPVGDRLSVSDPQGHITSLVKCPD